MAVAPILDQAAEVCARSQMVLSEEVLLHLAFGYIWSTPTCLVLAERWDKDANHASATGNAWWITLAVGTLAEFIRVDPLPETKWIGYRRARDGSVHWTDYQRLRERVKCGRLKA